MALSLHLVFLLGLTSLIAGTLSAKIERRAAGCPSGWSPIGNRCFMVRTHGRSMASAESCCLGLGGNLASIHSAYENSCVRGLIRQRCGRDVDAWIGLFDSIEEGRWMWTDGSRVNFRDWGMREPNNVNGGENCVSIKHHARLDWNDVKCRNRLPYVCARDK